MYGVKELLKNESSKHGYQNTVPTSVIVISGLKTYEIYPFLLSIIPQNYTMFIASERYFDSIQSFFPGMIKLLVSDKATTSEFLHAFYILNRMCEQNERKPYFPEMLRFSKAEVELLELIDKGHSLREVAAIRGVSPKTISVQRQILMGRMGITSAQGLISLARIRIR